MSQPVATIDIDPDRSPLLKVLRRSRWAIWCVFIWCSLLCVTSTVIFLHQVQCSNPLDPFGGLYRDSRGAWPHLGGLLVRAIAGGWLALCLWKIQQVTSAVLTSQPPNIEHLLKSLGRWWNGLAVVCPVIVLFNLSSVAVFFFEWPEFGGAGRFKAGTMLRPKTKIEFRLAEFYYTPGLIESTMTVTEPVEKPIYLHRQPFIENDDIEDVVASLGPEGRPALSIRFARSAHERIGNATESHRHHPIAVMIDGKVITAPISHGRISDSAELTGEFTEKEAQRIANDFHGK